MRLAVLASFAVIVGCGPALALPRGIGQCERTKITSVSDRFGNFVGPNRSRDDLTGTIVSFANRLDLVSYNNEPEVLRSRLGDAVMVCLVSIPKGCPPGDNRGRVYTATNLRTQGSWTLPDSQHMCGGA